VTGSLQWTSLGTIANTPKTDVQGQIREYKAGGRASELGVERAVGGRAAWKISGSVPDY
jgi:hypothetical protein